jgi:hypothetical protein
LVAVVAVIGGGCASTDYDRRSVEEDLVESTALTEAQAACLTRRLEATIGLTRLGARDAPTEGERDRMHGGLVMAIVGCSGEPYARDAIVTGLAEQANLGRDRAECLVTGVEGEVPPDDLAAPETIDDDRAVELGAAIAVATLGCDGSERDLRRNAALTARQAECVLEERAALETNSVGAFEGCLED